MAQRPEKGTSGQKLSGIANVPPKRGAQPLHVHYTLAPPFSEAKSGNFLAGQNDFSVRYGKSDTASIDNYPFCRSPRTVA